MSTAEKSVAAAYRAKRAVYQVTMVEQPDGTLRAVKASRRRTDRSYFTVSKSALATVCRACGC